jgi:hypothetical protein
MSLLVVQLNRAVNAIGPRLQLVIDQLACGFEQRLYSDWDAPAYPDEATASSDGGHARNGRSLAAVIHSS